MRGVSEPNASPNRLSRHQGGGDERAANSGMISANVVWRAVDPLKMCGRRSLPRAWSSTTCASSSWPAGSARCYRIAGGPAADAHGHLDGLNGAELFPTTPLGFKVNQPLRRPPSAGPGIGRVGRIAVAHRRGRAPQAGCW